jgi:hypothetical protein
MSQEPKYEILQSYGKIELRVYAPFLVAEVHRSGKRKEAIREGFRILADYLFGNNETSIRLPMSIPVTQQKTGDFWTIRFMLTQASEINTLPRPKNPLVHLLSIPQTTFAVIQFSGTPKDEKLESATAQLRAFAASHNLRLEGEPIFAFYNPPWTLPFLRRNEVLIECRKT